jgi:hypothetical protein
MHCAQAKASEIQKLIEHQIRQLQGDAQHKPIAICIWGSHGIGKTALVKSYAEQNQIHYSYFSPAQYEEMGDLVGMPFIDLEGRTQFAKPQWVPETDGPGILLIDDINRADDRILRGLMPFVQNQELGNWKLPKGWLIVLTANPEDQNYTVSSMDEAMLTRMIHVEMIFDIKDWLDWAKSQKIDPRGIGFVQNYPEIINFEKTTPRTLAYFFQLISDIQNLDTALDLVYLYAHSALDEHAANSFISYVQNQLRYTLSPQQILEGNSFKNEVEILLYEQSGGGQERMDLLSLTIDRLINYISSHEDSISDTGLERIKSFLLIPFLPGDLRLHLYHKIGFLPHPKWKKITENQQIGTLILELL